MKTSILAVILSWQVVSGSLHQTQCLRHCAAFDRGYAWGLDNGIASEFECDGHGSVTFIAGCAAYIDDNLPDQSFSINPDDGDDEDDEEDHVLQHEVVLTKSLHQRRAEAISTKPTLLSEVFLYLPSLTPLIRTFLAVQFGVRAGEEREQRMASPADLYGTWRLVSWIVEVIETGEQFRQFGDDPPGFIHFAPEGRMFAVLTASGRKPVETEADQVAAFGSLIAYTGRYHIEGNKLVTTVDVSADPTVVGTDLVRFFDLRGDSLEIKTAPFFSQKPSLGFGDKQLQSFLLWQRDKRES